MAWMLRPVATLHPSFTTFRVKVITSNRYFDITKAKKVLGYRPIVPMNVALERTISYWKAVAE
jgi:sterol-4alpha-carboxylate 3-dehydrogenase (decarboxylating)